MSLMRTLNMRTLMRLFVVALLGVATAGLVSCGSSGSGLIPSANAGPLQNDFEEVARAAATGNGNCEATESALGKTQQDFLALPATVDRGLRKRLQEGIANLRKQARAMCIQPAATATTTTGSQTTSTPTTSTTTTETTPSTTPSTTSTTPTITQTTPTTTTPQNPGGGVEAPGESHAEETPGKGKDKGEGEGRGKADAEGNGAGSAGGASAGGGP